MKENASLTFHLGSFSGPLEFLIALVQNQELNIEDIPLQELTRQYAETLQNGADLDEGAEFVGSASLLIWLKSKQLLPQHEQPPAQEEELDPRFEIIHHLIDYCRFREAAKQLSEREQRQSAHYFRGVGGQAEVKKPLGIEHLSLDDFASLFKQLVAKASSQRGVIHEEEWRVSDKIGMLRALLADTQEIEFIRLFSSSLCREELIVTFLAVLEMMKGGEISVVKVSASGQIMIAAKEKYGPRN